MADVTTTTLAPSRLLGHGLAAMMAVASLVGGFAALNAGLPRVMGVTMLVVGVLVPWLVWLSLRHSRAAWSYLIATVGAFATVCLFGAPKIGHLLGIGLGPALFIPALQITCVCLLATLRAEYQSN